MQEIFKGGRDELMKAGTIHDVRSTSTKNLNREQGELLFDTLAGTQISWIVELMAANKIVFHRILIDS